MLENRHNTGMHEENFNSNMQMVFLGIRSLHLSKGGTRESFYMLCLEFKCVGSIFQNIGFNSPMYQLCASSSASVSISEYMQNSEGC